MLRTVRRKAGQAYLKFVRPALPGRNVLYAGISVPLKAKIGDSVIRRLGAVLPRDRPNYESALIAGLRRAVRHGDQVTIVGGGWGVTAVIAAELAGRDSIIRCYEPSYEQYAKLTETLRLNGAANVQSHRAFVGPHDHAYGDVDGADEIAISELNTCDILELDCEGAERDIICNLSIRPRAIIVETHGLYGSPTSDLSLSLERIGYDVINMGVAEPDSTSWCLDSDIHVLLGTRAEAGRS